MSAPNIRAFDPPAFVQTERIRNEGTWYIVELRPESDRNGLSGPPSSTVLGDLEGMFTRRRPAERLVAGVNALVGVVAAVRYFVKPGGVS